MKKSSQILYHDLTNALTPYLDTVLAPEPVRIIMDYYYEAPHTDISVMKKNLLTGYDEVTDLLEKTPTLGSVPAVIKTIMDYCYVTTVKPVIVGIKGTQLTPEERLLFKTEHPAGVILFRRNIDSEIVRDPVTKEVVQVIQNRQQLLDLVSSIKDELGEGAIIAIDQEGGRVRRLTVPTFEMRPSASTFGVMYDEKGMETAMTACKANFRDIARELNGLGINTNFAPIADVRYTGAHDVIGDRSFSSDPAKVFALCKAALEGTHEVGVKGVIKHIPGHGRSTKDSHTDLPIVTTSLSELEGTDFRVFRELAPFSQWAMTAHIIYTALDSRQPVTLSKSAIQYIRDELGFRGIIISDAIEMRALSSSKSPGEIAQLSLEAGIDIILECTGDINNMSEVLGAVLEVDLS